MDGQSILSSNTSFIFSTRAMRKSLSFYVYSPHSAKREWLYKLLRTADVENFPHFHILNKNLCWQKFYDSLGFWQWKSSQFKSPVFPYQQVLRCSIWKSTNGYCTYEKLLILFALFPPPPMTGFLCTALVFLELICRPAGLRLRDLPACCACW